MQIMGLDGRAQVLREQAKALDMNVDKIVPSATALAMKAKVAMMQQAMAGGPGAGMPGAAPAGPPVAGRPAPAMPGGGRQLPHGQGPVQESFQNT
jgi:hypothetical protein